jgi:hypothetical protein
VDSLSSPATRSGAVDKTEKEYVLHFPISGDGGMWDLRYRINRFTGQGARSLIKPDGRSDPTMTALVTCKPYIGPPL